PVYRLSSVLLSLLAIGSPAYCLSLSLLSLPSAAHLRPLPSFPTRRSSDLSRFRTYSLFLFGRAVRPEEACLRTAGYEIRRIEESSLILTLTLKLLMFFPLFWHSFAGRPDVVSYIFVFLPFELSFPHVPFPAGRDTGACGC